MKARLIIKKLLFVLLTFKLNERSGLFYEEVFLTTLQMYTAGRLHCRFDFHIKYGGLHDGFVLSRSESNFSFLVESCLKKNYKIIQKQT